MPFLQAAFNIRGHVSIVLFLSRFSAAVAAITVCPFHTLIRRL